MGVFRQMDGRVHQGETKRRLPVASGGTGRGSESRRKSCVIELKTVIRCRCGTQVDNINMGDGWENRERGGGNSC